MKIKVLHIGYSDDYGGASIAMNRIHQSVSLNPNITSKIAVIHKTTLNDEIYSLSKTIIEKIWKYLRVRIAYKSVKLLQKTKNTSGRSINFFPSSVIKRIDEHDADVIHLHWIGNETIRIEDLKKLRQPIIWTFHDKWPMLGAEYTDLSNSQRFKNGYKKSNRPKESKGFDIDKWVWKRKFNIFRQLNITIVPVSSWLLKEVNKSLIWKDARVVMINNPIDKSKWIIKDRKECKTELKIPLDYLVITFGAINALTDKLKGFDLLEKALDIFSVKHPDKSIFCIVFGDENIQTINRSNKITIKVIGKISDHNLINTVYSASDVVVVPSYFETFGQIALESICCGTPVACFKTSGLMDIVEDGSNGSYAKPYDPESLADSMWEAKTINLNENYIEKFASKFSLDNIGKQYVNLYNEVFYK